MCFQLSSSPTYGVYTAFYQRDGRRFQEVGSYVGSTLRLTGDQQLFPNVEFGLNGRRLLVTTNYVRIKLRDAYSCICQYELTIYSYDPQIIFYSESGRFQEKFPRYPTSWYLASVQ